MSYRVKQIDPDFRKTPRTDGNYCARCMKDINTGDNENEIYVSEDGFFMIHPLDRKQAGKHYVGMLGATCLKIVEREEWEERNV